MMIHIVCWKFKEEAGGHTKEENLREAKRRLEALPLTIAEIRSFQAGIDEGRTEFSYDLVLHSTFDNAATLEAYQNHPDHQEAVKFLRSVHEGRIVVDYRI
jgi:Stress responsive A/B Barrel Domain